MCVHLWAIISVCIVTISLTRQQTRIQLHVAVIWLGSAHPCVLLVLAIGSVCKLKFGFVSCMQLFSWTSKTAFCSELEVISAQRGLSISEECQKKEGISHQQCAVWESGSRTTPHLFLKSWIAPESIHGASQNKQWWDSVMWKGKMILFWETINSTMKTFSKVEFLKSIVEFFFMRIVWGSISVWVQLCFDSFIKVLHHFQCYICISQ